MEGLLSLSDFLSTTRQFDLKPDLPEQELARRVGRAYWLIKEGSGFRPKVGPKWFKAARFLVDHKVQNALSYCHVVKLIKRRIFPNFLWSEKVYQDVEKFLRNWSAERLLELYCQCRVLAHEIELCRRIKNCDDCDAALEVVRNATWLDPVLRVIVYGFTETTPPEDLLQQAWHEYLISPVLFDNIVGSQPYVRESGTEALF